MGVDVVLYFYNQVDVSEGLQAPAPSPAATARYARTSGVPEGACGGGGVRGGQEERGCTPPAAVSAVFFTLPASCQGAAAGGQRGDGGAEDREGSGGAELRRGLGGNEEGVEEKR